MARTESAKRTGAFGVSAGLALAIVSLAFACGSSEDPPAEKSNPASPPAAQASPAKDAEKKAPSAAEAAPSNADLVAKGRQVYVSNCTACHNPNPTENGALGPAIAGSSLALLEAKVIHNTYPPGYTPKRDTNAMIALPHLAKDIPALHAYLGSIK